MKQLYHWGRRQSISLADFPSGILPKCRRKNPNQRNKRRGIED